MTLALALLPAGALAKSKRHPPAAPSAEAASEDGYFYHYLTGSAGQKIPVMEYPGSATVITRKMMDDFQARSVCDALRLAPAVAASGCW
jgi:outer membrane receptor for ferric coprogen and ferric-rhodotorulic acid